jgi:four helix bundle protein
MRREQESSKAGKQEIQTMSGRLQGALLDRVVEYGSRVLALVETLEQARRPRRVIDQLTGSGTSPGAHLFEANEAISRAEFIKLVSGAAKELSETRYWLQLIMSRGWITAERLDALLGETDELLSIVKVVIARSRRQ